MKKVFITAAAAMCISTAAYAENPFNDVSQGHWAYDAVSKLAAEGVVDG